MKPLNSRTKQLLGEQSLSSFPAFPSFVSRRAALPGGDNPYEEYLLVLALAAMPALGNFAGGLLAEMVAVSQRALSLALHGAAGIVIAVVAVELMPTALKTDVPWVIIVAFMLGGGFLSLSTR